MPPTAEHLEAMIERFGLTNVLEAITEVCDLNAERCAVNYYDVLMAKCWAQAQTTVAKAQVLLAPLNL